MPYDSVIQRSDMQSLIPEDLFPEIIQGATASSAVLALGRRLRDMRSSEMRMPVLTSLPTAYFVDGEAPSGGLKQTTKMAWANKYINAEEIAVIVPIPENVLDDSGFPIWDQVRPRLVEAAGVLIDQAVLFGTGAPSTWPTDIVTGATAAGNTVAYGTGTDLYDDLLGEDGTFSLVEQDGFLVTGTAAHPRMRGRLRGLREPNGGQPIFMRAPDAGQNLQNATRYELDGSPVFFLRNGAFDEDEALAISGDWDQLVYAFRRDITWKLLDQAVLTDGSGNIIYNLAQNDMVALRMVMRLGWQLPNPINRLSATEGGVIDSADVEGRYPFAILTPAAAS